MDSSVGESFFSVMIKVCRHCRGSQGEWNNLQCLGEGEKARQVRPLRQREVELCPTGGEITDSMLKTPISEKAK